MDPNTAHRSLLLGLLLLMFPSAAPAQPPADAPGDDVFRRREDLAFCPPLGCEKRFQCALKGRLKAAFWGSHEVVGRSVLLRRVVQVDDNPEIYHVATSIESGTFWLDDKAQEITGDPEVVMALFDNRHRLLQVDTEKPLSDDSDRPVGILDLASVLMYTYFSVPYHVRTAGIGTTWSAEYDTIDADGRSLPMSGDHELIAFALDGEGKIGVILSKVRVPVRGEINDFALSGTLEFNILSEVYLGCGRLRYRRGMGGGELKARGAITVDVEVKDFQFELRKMLDDGTVAGSLYDELAKAP